MLKLTLATPTPWSADGSVFVNPRAIAAMVRCLPSGLAEEHTLVVLLVRSDSDAVSYPVTETPDEITHRIEVLK